MALNDNNSILSYHLDKVIKYGPGSSQAQGWKNKEGQEKRFEILATIGNLNNCSVLDAGCGYGDLLEYLNTHFKIIRYVGIDFQNSFLDHAKEKYSNMEEASFLSGDFATDELPVTDFILLSGALNYKSSQEDYAKKVIARLFQTCRTGFGFNMLGKTTFHDPLLCAYNADEIRNYCKTLSPDIVFKDEYYENDFTVLMRH